MQDDIFESENQHIRYTLEKIYSNIYHAWDKDLYSFVNTLSNRDWRRVNVPFLSIERYLEENRYTRSSVFKNILISLQKMDEYMKEVTWFDEHSQFDKQLQKIAISPIAYFCAEFGLVDWIQIYSGGLGMLAGDYLKQTSDMGVPVVGLGIFYHQGYFHQHIDLKGMQYEDYAPQDPVACNLKLVRNQSGNPIETVVMIADHEVYVRAWELKIGRNKLVLLDTNYDKNTVWEDRMITAHLYGGDEDTRIRQEIVLGIGGYRILKIMNITPSIVHLNEGHASFVVLEKILQQEKSIKFDEKLAIAKKNVIFTNHTLNAAGNDKFDFKLVKKYLESYASQIGSSVEEIFHLGVDEKYSKDQLSMTILGFHGSKITNAVSQLHGKVASKIWSDFEIRAVTNGVHLPTWISKSMQELIDTYVDKEWRYCLNEPNWKLVEKIPLEKIREVHDENKIEMITRINHVLGCSLNPNALTIIWTRRFAAYKRPEIIFNDLESLSRIVNNVDHPVQIIIGGKAHPKDKLGKELLQETISKISREDLKNKITFLPGYNCDIARYLVTGADIWLNTPTRYEEACGTSGMKAGANGALQFTTLDGWTDEVDWMDKGWILPQEGANENIYKILEEKIIPIYYLERQNWCMMMRNTIQTVYENFSARRMVEDYLNLYKEVL